MNAIIRFQSVSKSFGKNKVLDSMSMEIPKGKITFIIGKSGEGKSVTLKHIVGLIKPDSGRIEVDGDEVNARILQNIERIRRKIGYLFQDGALFDSHSVAQNIAFPLLTKNNGFTISQIEEKVLSLLSLVGLEGKQLSMPSELSIGEKKRVGLARALALGPKILLYDEPTTSMDAFVSELIDDLIVKLQKQDPELTSIVVSHDVTSILRIAQNIVFLHNSKVHLSGPIEDFYKSQDPIVQAFLAGKYLKD